MLNDMKPLTLLNSTSSVFVRKSHKLKCGELYLFDFGSIMA
jgi:hypothetical protein